MQDKELRAQERTMEKARREEKARRSRENRAVPSADRNAAAAEKNAARTKAKVDESWIETAQKPTRVLVRKP